MANPVLKEGVFNSGFGDLETNHSMSINGTILKTCMLGLFTALTFAYTWYLQMAGFADKVFILRNVGTWGGLILALFICFGPKNRFLAITTPLYAMCEGLFLGSYSALLNTYYPGIASQAAVGTMFALFSMFVLYKFKIIKCSQLFRSVIATSTLAIFLVYLLQIVMVFIFHTSIPAIFTSSPIGIAFSAVVVLIASFNLILDFDFVEKFSGRVPSYYEWYGGFALLVTIIWLYIEILNLLAKIANRNNG